MDSLLTSSNSKSEFLESVSEIPKSIISSNLTSNNLYDGQYFQKNLKSNPSSLSLNKITMSTTSPLNQNQLSSIRQLSISSPILPFLNNETMNQIRIGSSDLINDLPFESKDNCSIVLSIPSNSTLILDSQSYSPSQKLDTFLNYSKSECKPKEYSTDGTYRLKHLLDESVAQSEFLNKIFFQPKIFKSLSYPTQCTLQQLLRQQTLEWNHFFNLLQQLCSALAFLHLERSLSEISFSDQLKLKDKNNRGCFVLRNLRTDRLIINSNGRLQISHMQHTLFCPVYAKSGHPLIPIRVCNSESIMHSKDHSQEPTLSDYNPLNDSETSIKNSLNQLVRQKLAEEGIIANHLEYCAPELLRQEIPTGPLDARLRQLDIYALGVCVWEMASRTTHLYQGVPVPDYREPLAQELKFAQMRRNQLQLRLLVDTHQTRPLFPDLWKDTNIAIRGLKDIMEDCWDPEPEARISVFCVQERLKQVLSDWNENRSLTNRGISSKIINQNQISNKAFLFKNFNGKQCQISNNNDSKKFPNRLDKNLTNKILTKNELNRIHNRFIDCRQITMQRPPFQGQNLCMQRNLLTFLPQKFSDEEEKFQINICTSKFSQQKQSNVILASQLLSQTSEVLSFLEHESSTVSSFTTNSPLSSQIQSKSAIPLQRNLLKPKKQLNSSHNLPNLSEATNPSYSNEMQTMERYIPTFVDTSSTDQTKDKFCSDTTNLLSIPSRPFVRTIGNAFKVFNAKKWLSSKNHDSLCFYNLNLIELDPMKFTSASLSNKTKSRMSTINDCKSIGSLHRVAELTTI